MKKDGMKIRIIKNLFWSLPLILSLSGLAHTDDTVAVEQTKPQPTFVFDLGGVLFDTSTFAFLRQLGIKDTLRYVARHRSLTILKSRFYKTVDRTTRTRGNSLGLKDANGIVLPQLMVDWLRGSSSNELILDRVLFAIQSHPEWFVSETEKRIMAAMARAIFDPQQFAASRKLLPGLVPFITTLKKHNAKLYILSNWDKESFALLKQKHKKLFDLFDGCIISGEVGYVKPEQEIFQQVINKTAACHACLIDDQPENIQAAQQAGLSTILVEPKATSFGSKMDTDSIIKKGIALFKKQKKEIRYEK